MIHIVTWFQRRAGLLILRAPIMLPLFNNEIIEIVVVVVAYDDVWLNFRSYIYMVPLFEFCTLTCKNVNILHIMHVFSKFCFLYWKQHCSFTPFDCILSLFVWFELLLYVGRHVYNIYKT